MPFTDSTHVHLSLSRLRFENEGSNVKICTATEIRKLTGTNIPTEQVAALRQRGLNPFVCPINGTPIIDERVILASMLGKSDDATSEFKLNEEAFN